MYAVDCEANLNDRVSLEPHYLFIGDENSFAYTIKELLHQIGFWSYDVCIQCLHYCHGILAYLLCVWSLFIVFMYILCILYLFTKCQDENED